MDIQADIPSSALEAKRLLGILSCEPPNSDLHNFIGNFACQPKSGEPLKPLLVLEIHLQQVMKASAHGIFVGFDRRESRM